MSDNKELDQVLDHDYDGIQEYDNPLPSWWLATFFITIIFGFIYWIHYEFGGGMTQKAELAADLAQIQASAQKQKSKNPQPVESDETYKSLMASAEMKELGKQVYAGKCLVCHGDAGQGLVGPNLADDYWIHGQGSYMDISKVIREGVAAKGMPAWGPMLKENELKAIVVFVAGLHGTNPAGAKAPQGEKVEVVR